MPETRTRILLVEDDEADAARISSALGNGASARLAVERVASLGAALARLHTGGVDAMLVGLGLPDADMVARLKSAAPRAALVVLAGKGEEGLAARAVREGAQDYLSKPEIRGDLLEHFIRHAIERKRAEEDIRQILSSARCILWHALVKERADGLAWDFKIRNPEGAYALLPLGVPPGLTYEEAWVACRSPEVAASMDRVCCQALRDGLPGYQQEFWCHQADGERRWLREDVHIERAGPDSWRLVGICTDVTQRKRAEEERCRLEEELRQALKLEAIGRLAGGIAHDFNNLLMPILGYADLMLMRLEPDSPLYRYAEQIARTAEHASTLPRQLLAFSRHQVMEPQIADLNAVVAEVDKMLRRVIGEDIDLTTILAEGLGRVKVDPGQIQQVILNLAVNARDAMPAGGSLTIETSNVSLGSDYTSLHLGVEPGRYVAMAITDTGCGMDKEILSHIFEPFYTTKEEGKGTGLGLATVYGIVKQSGGTIRVYSEPNRGACFRIYLPQVDGEPSAPAEAQPPTVHARGSETILLVEDDADVRCVTRRVLEVDGYSVIEAASGAEALDAASQHSGPIHLLLTDVVMPGMGGRDLAERLSALCTETKVLYISGYTENSVLHHGILGPGVQFLPKPFSPARLAEKVRQVLDARG